jgi:hypothetical protein
MFQFLAFIAHLKQTQTPIAKPTIFAVLSGFLKDTVLTAMWGLFQHNQNLK